MKRNRRAEKAIHKDEIGHIPHDLLRKIQEAWVGPPPTLPVAWMNPTTLEDHEAYVAFSGKYWDEISCNQQVPQHSLAWLCSGGAPGAAGYYLAHFIKCYFSASDDDKELITDEIHLFVAAILRRTDQAEVNLEQCLVVEDFLRHIGEFGPWYSLPDMVSLWAEMIERLSPP